MDKSKNELMVASVGFEESCTHHVFREIYGSNDSNEGCYHTEKSQSTEWESVKTSSAAFPNLCRFRVFKCCPQRWCAGVTTRKIWNTLYLRINYRVRKDRSLDICFFSTGSFICLSHKCKCAEDAESTFVHCMLISLCS